MARFLFLNQHYAPDVASTGQHLTDLAEWLVAAGHEVEVVASRSAYLGGKLRAPRSEVLRGVAVRRVRSTSFGRRNNLGRIVDYATFHARIGFEAAFGRKRPDLIITLTTPPLLGLWGEWARRFRRVKHVAFLMDLHPDAEIALGMLKADSWIGRLLRAGQRIPIARSAAGVVLGPYMAERLVRDGVPKERLVEIPIWNDGDDLKRVGDVAAWRAERGWSERFVVMYSGNAGRVHRFGEFLQAIRELDQTAPEIQFVFQGGGPRRKEIEAAVRDMGVSNTSFHDYVAREDLPTSMAAADVHLACLDPVAAGVSVPGKLIGILAAQKPLVFVGPRASESFQMVEESGGGFAVEPDGSVAPALLKLRDDATLRNSMGAKGRTWFEANCTREIACERWRVLLERVVAGQAICGSGDDS